MALSAARAEQFGEAFDVLGNKAASVDEHMLGVILRSLGQNPSNDEVSGLFKKHGGSKEAVLAAAGEFEAGLAGADLTSMMREAFSVFDKDKTGKISAAELRHIISNLGEPVDEDELEEMMKEADADGSGTIEYAEFVGVLTRAPNVPPPVDIPEDLLDYMNLDKAKKDKKAAAAAEQAAIEA